MYTFDDILALPEGERAELIDGEMFKKVSPTLGYQDACGWLLAQIFNYIQGKRRECRVYSSGLAIFPKKDNINYVVPDVTVVCDRGKLDNRGCSGAPEWVIEIVLPSNIKMDYERKLKFYQERDYSFADMVKACIYEDLELDLGGLQKYLKG